MLILESLWRGAGRLPGLVRIGLLGLAFAGLADVVAHLEAGIPHADRGAAHHTSGFEFQAHLAAFVSMVLIQVGVVRDGVRRNRIRPIPADRTREGAA